MQSFSTEKIRKVYNSYCTQLSLDTIEYLLQLNTLAEEQKRVLYLAMESALTRGDFFRKSCFVYLANAIIAPDITEKKNLIAQSILECAVRILEDSRQGAIELSNDGILSFSVLLNQKIPNCFDQIKKDNDHFLFFKNNEMIFSCTKKYECAIAKDIDFLIADVNPFNKNITHPDAPPFSAYDLGGIPVSSWAQQFRDAYALIQEKVPSIYDEIYYFLDAIVPHGYQPQKQLSSTFSKSPGIIYLSYTDSVLKQAEAIIHEIHHNIYNVIEWKNKLLENDRSETFYSAYRPDARHMHGCFLGFHAFVAVQNFYGQLSKTDASHIPVFLRLYCKNAYVIEVVKKYALLTESGEKLFSDIILKYESDTIAHGDFAKKYPLVADTVKREAEQHLEAARKRNAILHF